MSRPADAAREAHDFDSGCDRESSSGPDDNVSAGLHSGLDTDTLMEPTDRDNSAFISDDTAVTAEAQNGDASRRPGTEVERIIVPKQLTGEVDDPEAATRVRRSSGRVGRATVAADATVVTQVTDTDAIDLDFQEEDDFDLRTTDAVRAPTDPVEAIRLSMENTRILSREEVTEKAKEVEAGLVAGWVLRINDAVDSEDPDSLLKLRGEYIETRKANMRFSHKDGAEETDEGSTESEDQGSEDEATISKSKQIAQAAAQVREEKSAMAEVEADDLIALALRYREPAEEPGKTILAKDVQTDLDELETQGTRAKDAMVESIMRWAFKQSMKYAGMAQGRARMSPDDVIQEGYAGAIRTVEKFDHTKGYTLATYSDAWIRQSISKAVGNGGMIRTPQKIGEDLATIRRVEDELRAELEPGEEFTEEMVAARAKMKPAKLAELRKVDLRTLSLDQRVGDGGSEDVTIGETVEDERTEAVDAQVAEKERQILIREVVADALEGLNDERAAIIMRRRFGVEDDQDGEPDKLDDLAKRFDVSRERIRQIEKRVKAKILDNKQLAARVRPLLR